MGKSLVIVESPAKAKTINKYLGKDYVVKSSVGHVRDLPKGGKKPTKKAPSLASLTKGMSDAKKEAFKKERNRNNLIRRMGINPDKDWKAQYEVLPGKEKVVDELKKLAAKADTIYLATDLDREGEAIAWHLREVIGGENDRYQRVTFNEITKTAIQEAFQQTSELDINRVNAQQARRFLDRVVGFMVSPLLWEKIGRGLSAGRVQSVAVRLIVEREQEINAFIPDEFWDIHADLKTQNKEDLRVELSKYKSKKFVATNEKDAMATVADLQKADYSLIKREDRATSSKPKAPFITSTLQQAASTRYGFGVKRTMGLAQRLYEAGYITYMRTDSTNLSKDAIESARNYIDDKYGNKYLPAKPITYGSKEGAQEAHEAIRPSNVKVMVSELKGVDDAAKKLYELIWRQFVACQMVPAKYDSTRLIFAAGDYELVARGRTMRFDGWTKVLPPMQSKSAKAANDVTLPHIDQGDPMNLVKIDPQQRFTKPPARYSEASLVKELEKRGIGRPSTYASIISTIQDRGYVRVDSRRFFAEKIGEIVTKRLLHSFDDLMSYNFTAEMEEKLDKIADGGASWTNVLDSFYDDFTIKLDNASNDPTKGGMPLNNMVMTDISCPTCSRDMGIRNAGTGVFLGCDGYNLPPKERCKTTINLVPGDESIDLNNEDAETEALMSKRRCPKCGTAMDAFFIDEENKLHVCGNNPECDGYELEKGQFKLKGYDGPVVECEKCGSEMHLTTGRFGPYMKCTSTNKPEDDPCKNTRKILRNGEVAPPREDPVHIEELPCEKSDAYFILRDGAAGIFLAASTYPKSRETRAPLVEELARFRDRISSKFYYLADAPQEDSKGNKTLVRYLRKEKKQYVRSEVDGKATGWAADYIDGKWVVRDKPIKAKGKSKAKKKTTKKKTAAKK